ncbi:MAG TPA: sorbosone dehydrogenase family protein, partial [Methylophaga sp.]|nr:sorbosone dehydrogenase family protein [Methylophaga sp.]
FMILGLNACADNTSVPKNVRYGANPSLPEPNPGLLPTVNIAPAIGWTEGDQPTAAKGLAVNAFARGLDHPRWLYVLPNGDILVAETNAQPNPDADKSLKSIIMGWVMKRAGAAVPSADRISLLRDKDGDGVAETKTVFIDDLKSPFGMALIGNDLYVANTDAIVRFPYQQGATEITAAGKHIVDLPAGPINYHWTKNIIASQDGQMLYATVGSNSNIGENGMENEINRAAILQINLESGDSELYAFGLRNPNGLAWHPETGELWTTVNERDGLGDNLVPDYMTSVQQGGFYGWPYSYYGQNVDNRVEPQRPDLVEKAIAPDYALGAHTASLGLAFYQADLLPDQFKGGAFIGQHGSWNRDRLIGYKVIFVPFKDGKPAGMPEDILTGFVNEDGDAQGRPVGVEVDNTGALLVADDVGNMIWRVTPDNLNEE